MGITKSKQPRKQRKFLYKAKWHIRHKLLAAPLSKGLADQHGVKSLPVRKVDTVLVVRGDSKGTEGKVAGVDYTKLRVHVENVKKKKADGSEYYFPIHPSKVVITKLNLKDERRKAIIERKKALVE